VATVVVRYALRVLLVLILGGGCLSGRALAQAAASPATAGPGRTAKATPAEAAAAKAAARAARIAAAQEAAAKRAALGPRPALAAPAAVPAVAAPAATPAVAAPAGKTPSVIIAPPGASPMASPGLALDPGAAATTENESSLARLAQPAFAEQLKLTDAQRVKITAILTERAQSLAKAGLAGRAKVVDEYEQKLSDVLTAEQRATLVKPPEPRLRFNFRFQRWIDVLEWFAKEADLSLVLDSPPPGTFNYSDTREYTPLEAIDLLNGVLLTKGFTLLRRERMLLVINLADGLPEGLIPRVTVEELDKRGKFEFVSVLFPLVGRNTTEVITEIKPLLGPYGKVTPLPVSAQILVTDTAGVMRAVGAVIQSMPPSPNAPVAPYEVPQLVV